MDWGGVSHYVFTNKSHGKVGTSTHGNDVNA